MCVKHGNDRERLLSGSSTSLEQNIVGTVQHQLFNFKRRQNSSTSSKEKSPSLESL